MRAAQTATAVDAFTAEVIRDAVVAITLVRLCYLIAMGNNTSFQCDPYSEYLV